MDAGLGAVYHDLSGLEPDKRMDAVRRWWANQLNPHNYRRAFAPDGTRISLTKAEQLAHDNSRYAKCLSLIQAKGLQHRPDYEALISSGALRFLTQTTTPFREAANAQAHLLLDTSNYRTLLEKAATDTSICPADSIGTVSSLLDFVEASQKRKVQ